MRIEVENNLIHENIALCGDPLCGGCTDCDDIAYGMPVFTRVKMEEEMNVWVVVDQTNGVSVWTTERQAQAKVEMLARAGYPAAHIMCTVNKDADDE